MRVLVAPPLAGRLAPPAGRRDRLCRVRRRPRHDRAGAARDLAVLRGDVLRADAGYLHSIRLIMVAADARTLRRMQFVVNLVELELLFLSNICILVPASLSPPTIPIALLYRH